MQRMAARRLC